MTESTPNVMPDHVHWLIQPLQKSESEFFSLNSIMRSIKSYSAKQIPKVMKHIGALSSELSLISS